MLQRTARIHFFRSSKVLQRTARIHFLRSSVGNNSQSIIANNNRVSQAKIEIPWIWTPLCRPGEPIQMITRTGRRAKHPKSKAPEPRSLQEPKLEDEMAWMEATTHCTGGDQLVGCCRQARIDDLIQVKTQTTASHTRYPEQRAPAAALKQPEAAGQSRADTTTVCHTGCRHWETAASRVASVAARASAPPPG